MQILYTAIEQKQEEIEERLTLNLKTRQAHILHGNDNDAQKTALDQKQQQLEQQLHVLKDIAENAPEHEELRLLARTVHTSLNNNESFTDEAANTNEIELLEAAAEKVSTQLLDFQTEYTSLKKAPPEGMSQHDLLILLVNLERKMLIADVHNHLIQLMLQQIQHEKDLAKAQDIHHVEPDGLVL